MERPYSVFLDGFSAELRLSIYKHALSFEHPLSPANGRAEICVSLFVVSKLVSREAINEFYRINVIRMHHITQFTPQGFSRREVFCRVRKLELLNPNYNPNALQFLFGLNQHSVRQILSLPQLETLTFGCDDIGWTSNITTRTFIRNAGLGIDLRCTAIGNFALADAFSKVRFKHVRLCKMWPGVLSTQPTPNVIQEISNGLEELHGHGPQCNTAALWALTQQDLPTWVALFDQLLRSLNRPGTESTPDLDISIDKQKWSKYTGQMNKFVDMPSMPRPNALRVPNPPPLRQLGSEHGSDVLEWVTELLSLNVGPHFGLPAKGRHLRCMC